VTGKVTGVVTVEVKQIGGTMGIFEEFKRESVRRMDGLTVAGGLITITRRATLQAEVNRILTQIAENRPEIDLGGAILKVPRATVVQASNLSQWAFNPPLLVQVSVHGWNLNAEILNVNLVIHDGRPAVEFITDSTLQPNIRFVFDDRKEDPTDEEIVVTFNRLRLSAIQSAGVPASKSQQVDSLLEKVQAGAAFHAASCKAFGTPKRERRAACKREAQLVYNAAQSTGVIGSGFIFWFTVGRYLLAAIEWLIWLSHKPAEE